MKRKCKKIDITDLDLIYKAVQQCFEKDEKLERKDALELLAEVSGKQKDEITTIVRYRDCDDEDIHKWNLLCRDVAVAMREKLIARDLKLPPLETMIRRDALNKKERKISILHIWQLLFDQLVVLSIQSVFKGVGKYQVSSIKGRGISYGSKAIKRWIKEMPEKFYAAKVDVKKFYESVDRNVLMDWLSKRIANPPLLWLIKTLFNTIDHGIPIGSFLSQTIANIFLSDLYHRAQEHYFFTRREERKKVFHHVLFYMDDMLFMGTNKKKMKESIFDLIEYAKNNLHLTIKPNWNVFQVTEEHPIIMMGFRFSRGKTSTKRKIRRSVRRMEVRARRERLEGGRGVSEKQARRMVSYFGYAKRTVCGAKGINILDDYRFAFETIRKIEEKRMEARMNSTLPF